ncbi:MAG: recombinase family protein [Bacteroidales bacterium]|nr:recombinase family protein [Bacteroidales bacterium]
MKKRVCIYSRVSKETGDYQRQISELKKIADERNYDIVEIIGEKISGGLKNEDRPGIEKMMNLVREGKIDKVLVWEASRISRIGFQAARIINELNEHGVSLYIKTYNLETLDENGEVNALAQFMLTLLNEFSSVERNAIKLRLQSGYIRYMADNGSVGRKSGSIESKEKFLQKHSDAVRLLNKGISIRNVAQLTGKSTKTIQKVKTNMDF